MSATATLTGRITITPPLTHDEVRRLPDVAYVRVEISAGRSDGLGSFERQGDAIVPGFRYPLATGGVAREVKDLIAAFPGHRFEGSLVREAAERFGSAKSRIAVLDDGRTVQY